MLQAAFHMCKKLYISLDLPKEPCNNYPVQMGLVWGCHQFG